MEEISFRRSAPRWWAVARVITVVALTAGCLTAVGTSAQAANLEQHNPVTDRRHCPAPPQRPFGSPARSRPPEGPNFHY